MIATLDKHDREILKASNPSYFLHHYWRLPKGEPFHLWPDQYRALQVLRRERFVSMLKARQTGYTTLVGGLAAHSSLYSPPYTTLLFSKSHLEAKDLLNRMIRRPLLALPEWMQPRRFEKDTTTELTLSNGSRFISFGSMASGGDSFTADLVVIDEADLIRDLDQLLSGAKPTIDAGGKLVILSRSEKSDPDSSFKRIMRAALSGESDFKPIFVPWWARPGRTREWYESIRKEILERTFGLDELYANYPATAEEALRARELDKRFPLAVLQGVFDEEKPLPASALRGTPVAGWGYLEVYRVPEEGESYTVGIDVAGGNPNSDDSVAVVVNKRTLEECAVLCGKIEPTVHAHRSKKLADWYHGAELMPEKNHSHGAKCLESLKALKARILKGPDGYPGWFTDIVRKNLMYDNVAEVVRTKQTIIHSKATFDQLESIDVEELSAPFGKHDDRAVAFGLAISGAARRMKTPTVQIVSGSNAQAPARVIPKFSGTRYIPTYDLWIALVEIGGADIVVGDNFEDEARAACAVNAGLTLTGRAPVNAVPENAEIVESVGRILKAKGVLP